MPKESVLRKKRDFDSVFKKGENFKSSHFVLKIAKNNLDISRFGFIVSQKVSKKAVVRNKIKRRLRAFVKNELKDIKKGIDVVLIALPSVENRDFSGISEDLMEIFKKAKIIVK